jgi:hypothetical protein
MKNPIVLATFSTEMLRNKKDVATVRRLSRQEAKSILAQGQAIAYMKDHILPLKVEADLGESVIHLGTKWLQLDTGQVIIVAKQQGEHIQYEEINILPEYAENPTNNNKNAGIATWLIALGLHQLASTQR